jgi:regulatory protein
MRTEKEVIKYLTDKYDSKDVENLVIRLKKEGLIDDSKYIKSFINDKINLSNDGPYKIKRDLIQKGIIEDLIEIDIDNNILLDKLRRIMPRYINLYKKNSKNIIKNKTVNYFLNLGYDKEIIEEVFDSLDVKGDNTKIKKDYEKLIKKYKIKYSGYKLESTIKQKLFQKGYSIDEIYEIEKGTI